MTKLGIFIFRRDCRLYDNIGLIQLAKQVDQILPLFILDSNKIVQTNKNSNYFSSNAVQFVCETIKDLDQDLKTSHGSKLFLLYGTPWEVIAQLLTRLNKTNKEIIVGFNTDFSSYSEKRDHGIRQVCSHLDIPVLESPDDYTLLPIDQLAKSDGTGFKQFGAFYKNTSIVNPSKPTSLPSKTKFVSPSFEKLLFKQLKCTYKIIDLGEFYETNEYLVPKT
jgi:deoxyribodipyrimidine photolyase